MRISYSGLDSFSNCPAKYKFQYIDKIKAPKSKDAIFGTLIHDCLKFFHEPSNLIPPSQDDLLKYFTEKWDSSIYLDSQEEAFSFHQGIDILKSYWEQNQAEKFKIINLETPFSIPLFRKKQEEIHQISGRIDRIDKLEDGTFEVIDYKTSKKMPSQETIDSNLQLSIYYLGIINRWPSLEKYNRKVKLTLYFLKHGEKLSTYQDNKKIAESKEKILSLIEQIQQSNFEPRANPLCDWCPYQAYCPLFKHKFMASESPAPDEKKIKEIIREFFEIKDQENKNRKRMAEIKEAINQYCEKNKLERVFGESGFITRLPQQRFSYDFIKVKKILEPLGKWDEILTIDKNKFKKVVNSLPDNIKRAIDQAKNLEKEFKVISASRTFTKTNS